MACAEGAAEEGLGMSRAGEHVAASCSLSDVYFFVCKPHPMRYILEREAGWGERGEH